MLIDPGRPDLLDDLVSGQRRPVVLIDGRSGSGKTTLAGDLAARHEGWQLVHADDMYRGWSGLASVWNLSCLWSDHPGYDRWDWDSGRVDGRVDLDPTRPLVVEGCGVLTPANSHRATVRVWCEAPEPVRRRRALSRDPEFKDWWSMWALQEGLHIARHRPADLADVTVG